MAMSASDMQQLVASGVPYGEIMRRARAEAAKEPVLPIDEPSSDWEESDSGWNSSGC